MVEQTVRGYRIVPVTKPDRELSYDYLHLKTEGAHAYAALRESVRKNGANCLGREEEFSGDVLMTDAEAQLECASCASFRTCDIFLKVGRPGWGTFAGKVQGRHLEELEREEQENEDTV